MMLIRWCEGSRIQLASRLLGLGLVLLVTSNVSAQDADDGGLDATQAGEIAAALEWTTDIDDIQALVWIIMMEAAHSAREDLENIMADV